MSKESIKITKSRCSCNNAAVVKLLVALKDKMVCDSSGQELNFWSLRKFYIVWFGETPPIEVLKSVKSEPGDLVKVLKAMKPQGRPS
jgi:hypothetical protein